MRSALGLAPEKRWTIGITHAECFFTSSICQIAYRSNANELWQGTWLVFFTSSNAAPSRDCNQLLANSLTVS